MVLNLKFIATFVLIFTFNVSKGWAFWFASSEKKNLESFESYDFPSCKMYEKEKEVALDVACELQAEGTISQFIDSAGKVGVASYQDFLISDMRLFILEALEKRITTQLDYRNCFDLIISRNSDVSDWCKNKSEVLKSEAREKYPRMRLHMALKKPFAQTHIGEAPVFEYNAYPYHVRNGVNVEPIVDAEIPAIKKQFDEETQTYSQEWLSLHREKKCIEKDDNGIYRFNNERCPGLFKETHNDFLSFERQKKTKEHDALYRQILGEYPHFAFIKKAELPKDEMKLNLLLSHAFDDLSGQSIKEYESLKKRSPSDFKFLLRYPNLIESYLQEKGSSEVACAAFQDLHNDYGEGGWDDITKDIGLGLAALTGGGACLLSAGVACAAVVAVGAEAIFISRDQERLNDGLSLYQAGFISSSRVDDLESSRNFGIALAPLSFIGLEGGKAVKGAGTNFAKRFFSRETLKNTQHWLHYMATTPLENRSWIRAARESSAHVYIDVENSALKRLNDTLGDKNLVTALTNMHKHILFDEMQVLIQKYPGLKIEKYSDFKSSRFALTFKDGKVPAGFENEFSTVMEKVAKRFDEEVAKVPGVNLGSEVPNRWFTAGLGESADQAGLATRQARDVRSGGQVQSFKLASKVLAETKESVESSRKFLADSLSGHAPQILTDVNGIKVPSLEVFELMRKAKGKNTAELVKSFKERFNVDLSDIEVEALTKYVKEVDQFSPGLWLPERVVANLDEAEFGGFSADFKGMGAKNMQQVALDLAHPGDSLAATVDRLRKGEEAVTVGFDAAKSSYQELIARELKTMGVGVVNKCSGDDCVSLPARALSRTQEEEIVKKIAAAGKPDGYRLSFIPPGIAAKTRSALAVHGELVEKEVRAALTGYGPDKISPEIMSDLTIAVRMPSNLGTGKVELVLAAGKESTLTPELKSLIENQLVSATSKVNLDLAKEVGGQFSYVSAY